VLYAKVLGPHIFQMQLSKEKVPKVQYEHFSISYITSSSLTKGRKLPIALRVLSLRI
jgi:hypothetical protein